MDFRELKRIIQDDTGGKFIIIENDQPVMVIMSFDEYRKGRTEPIGSSQPQPAGGSGDRVSEGRISHAPESVEESPISRPRQEEQRRESSKPKEELTLDDLPL